MKTPGCSRTRNGNNRCVIDRSNPSIDVARFAADHPARTEALNNVANIYMRLGRGADALPFAEEALAVLLHCLRALPAVDQRVFWLRERGRSYQEIGQTLHLNEGTIASKYHRTKEKIADCLQQAGIL